MRPWLEARKQASHKLCPNDFHRFRLGPGLPWPVRWSGRLLAVEAPRRRHRDFVDYFVCRCCGNSDSIDAPQLSGIIGAMPSDTAPDGLRLSLFDPSDGTARGADIDCLDIYPAPADRAIDYRRAIVAVADALAADSHRNRPLKKIPVRIHGGLALPENARRTLVDRFARVTDEPA